MKKTPCALLIPLALLAAACDNSDPATLAVYNNTGNEISSLMLRGPEKTGNLLDEPIANGETSELSAEIKPGTYTWRVEYGAGLGLASHYDSADWGVEIDLFPGRNTLWLEESGAL